MGLLSVCEFWKSFLEQSLECRPEDLCRYRLAELCTLVAGVTALWCLVLEMEGAEFRVVVVSMPTTVESRIRVGVVNPVERLITEESPFHSQCRWLRPSRWGDAVGVDIRLQVPFDDAVGLVDDSSGDGIPLQDVSESLIDRTVGRS